MESPALETAIDRITRQLVSYAIPKGMVVTDQRAKRLDRLVRDLTGSPERSLESVQSILTDKLYDIFAPHMNAFDKDACKEELLPIARAAHELAAERSHTGSYHVRKLATAAAAQSASAHYIN